MADRTGIDWTDATWNPTRGCSRVSEGCRNCYVEAIAARFSGPGQPYEGFADRTRTGSKWTGKVSVIWPKIDEPLHWRKPRRIFVDSMSDLFHEALPMEEIATIFAVAVAAVLLRGHTFQVLTKRSARMRQILNLDDFWNLVDAEAGAHVLEHTDALDRRSDDARATLDFYGPDNPPPGIHLGVSVEDQEAAEERIPHLLATPAAVRFLSCEPLLGPLNLRAIDVNGHQEVLPLGAGWLGRLEPGEAEATRIGWIIAGGESGPTARPANPQWFRDLRDQCAAAGVPFFFKQWGEWASVSKVAGVDAHITFANGCIVRRVGKHNAGNCLDGTHHLAFPA